MEDRQKFIDEALDYLKQEAGHIDRCRSWKQHFESDLFMLDETYQSPQTRGEIMQIAYDIVYESDK